MSADRLLDILARLAEKGSTFPSSASLCAVAADVSGTSGAGIMLNVGNEASGTLFSSDPVSARIEELQFTLGEGPCIDAHNQGRPVLEPDLSDPESVRWVTFTPQAVEAGARAIFGFPLTVGAIRLGALDLYRTGPGPLSGEQHADSLVVAGLIARTILAMQAEPVLGVHGAQGAPATQWESGANLRLVVHQASGMVSVQIGRSIAEALVRLRGYAFGHDLPIEEVARDVVSRRLRFDDPEGDPEEGTPQGVER